VTDNVVQRHAYRTLEIGTKDLDAYLKQLLSSDTELRHNYRGDITDDLIMTLKTAGVFEVSHEPWTEQTVIKGVEATYGESKVSAALHSLDACSCALVHCGCVEVQGL
jgi:hypothetical protein